MFDFFGVLFFWLQFAFLLSFPFFLYLAWRLVNFWAKCYFGDSESDSDYK